MHLSRERFHLSFILVGKEKTALSDFLHEQNISHEVIPYYKKLDLAGVLIRIVSILRRERPDVVHTHLFVANVTGLLAARWCGIKKRIFTRHHAMIHYEEYPSGRKWDVLCNHLATHIVAISKNVAHILLTKDHAEESKVTLIHHGFDLSYFKEVDPSRVDKLRQRYVPAGATLVVGVISRYLRLKGITDVIAAFARVREQVPHAHLLLANTTGDYAREVRQALSTLPSDSYTEILFEADLAALYRVLDVYVHVPIGPSVEAFGQTYVEALASGVPSVFTLSGVAPEFIRDGENACVVPFQNPQAIADAIWKIHHHGDLREKLRGNGLMSVEDFRLEVMIRKLEELYAG